MTTSGVAPSFDTCSTIGQHLERERAALGLDESANRVGRTLADLAAVAHVHPRHAGLSGERHEHRAGILDDRQAEVVDRQLDDRTPLGRLVGQRRDQGALGEVARRSRR